MKASLSFRDDQKPLVRAKIPISVLGLPFISGVSAGEAKELRLDLATAFESGPSFRVSYRPNDPWSPFGLVVKTGMGAFGSPAGAPLTMSAEFNLVGRAGPSFAIRLKPRFGDFCLKKATHSATPAFSLGRTSVVDHDTDGEGSVDGVESPIGRFPPETNRMFGENKPNGIATGIPGATAGGIHRLLSGVELTARSVLPLRNCTAVKFRWGLRFPHEHRSGLVDHFASKDPIGGIPLRKLPLLAMSKISIEHLAREEKRRDKAADVAEACFSVQKQLAALQVENSMLRKAVEEVRADLGARKPDTELPSGAVTAKATLPEARVWEGHRNGVKLAEPAKNSDGGQKGSAKAAQAGGKAKEDVNEELRKALMGTTGAGV